MITIILIFLLFSVLEILIIWSKWSEISDFVSLGKVTSKVVGMEEKYTGIINKIVIWFIKRKNYVWIPIGILLMANVIIAIIISFFIWVLQLILSLF